MYSAEATNDIDEERSAALSQKLKNRGGAGTQAERFRFARFATWDHPLGIFAHEESDGSDARRSDAAFCAGDGFERGGMRRQAAPTHNAGETKLIENRWIVIGDAAF